MLDAVHFEALGVPAAAILTEPFAATGEAIAELQGCADYPIATVPHPIGSLTQAEAMALADAVTPTVLGLLTTTRAQSADVQPADTQPAPDGRPSAVDTPSPGNCEPAGTHTPATPATGSGIADVVEALAAVLRADRADLTASVAAQHVTLQLHIPDDACAECVLPASMLSPMFQHRFDTELGTGWTVTLDDPREQALSDPAKD